MKKIFTLLLILFLFPRFSSSQELTYMFRLLLTDKGESPYSIDQPLQFLSPKAMERRYKQNIPIDQRDLPIDTSYINQIEAFGVKIVAQSKWMQTVTVETKDSSIVHSLETLPFVDTLHLVYRKFLQELNDDERPDTLYTIRTDTPITNSYGESFSQIAIHNGNLLHDAGYKGSGMTIAVIDGGFQNADLIDALNQEQIISTKNFTHATGDPFRSAFSHGTHVLSIMLSNKKNVMVGTAPEAQFYLFCSEVNGEEYPVEEDYWISAIEYADSIGVDITTTSLGYTIFDLPAMNHTKEELDGKSTLISRAATIAAEKGILVLNAAGNEGNKTWSTVSFPSDADKIITVGSILADSSLSSFTPTGPTKDNRIKPDIMGIGTQTTLIGSSGNIQRFNGTSYSTPVITGLMACLWQALPQLTNLELIKLVQQSANKYNEPDNRYGYGIPDVFKAYESQATSLQQMPTKPDSPIRHIGHYLLINANIDQLPDYQLSIYNILGERIEFIRHLPYPSFDVSHFSKGVYIALLEGLGIRQTYKFIIR